MSIKLMSYAWENYQDSSHVNLLILLTLADHANDDGVCWPSVKRITARVHCSEKAFYLAMEKLQADGWIKKEHQNGKEVIYTVLSPTVAITGLKPLQPTPGTGYSPSNRNHKEPPAKDKKPRSPEQEINDMIFDGITFATKSPEGSFNGVLTANIRKLNPTVSKEWWYQEITRRFGENGLWYKNDFRGQRGQPPTPSQVLSEWNRVLISKKTTEKERACNDDLVAQGYKL